MARFTRFVDCLVDWSRFAYWALLHGLPLYISGPLLRGSSTRFIAARHAGAPPTFAGRIHHQPHFARSPRQISPNRLMRSPYMGATGSSSCQSRPYSPQFLNAKLRRPNIKNKAATQGNSSPIRLRNSPNSPIGCTVGMVIDAFDAVAHMVDDCDTRAAMRRLYRANPDKSSPYRSIWFYADTPYLGLPTSAPFLAGRHSICCKNAYTRYKTRISRQHCLFTNKLPTNTTMHYTQAPWQQATLLMATKNPASQKLTGFSVEILGAQERTRTSTPLSAST